VINGFTWNDFTVIANSGERTIEVHEPPNGSSTVSGFGNRCMYGDHDVQ
jgi:hypothetical protein